MLDARILAELTVLRKFAYRLSFKMFKNNFMDRPRTVGLYRIEKQCFKIILIFGVNFFHIYFPSQF
jgi:hypothetical protein